MAATSAISPAARRAGSANLLYRRGGRWVGDTTDPAGILESLAMAGSFRQICGVAVVGCGGSGRAIAAALGRAGAEVVLSNRGRLRGERASRWLGMPLVDLALFSPSEFDMVINATTVGRSGTELPFAVEDLSAGTIVVDLVYSERPTPLAAAAAARGAEVIDGFEVLLIQTARQFEKMTGRTIPVDLLAGPLGRSGGPRPTSVPVPVRTGEPGRHRADRSPIGVSRDDPGPEPRTPRSRGSGLGTCAGAIRRPGRPIRPGCVFPRRGLRRPLPRRAARPGRPAVARRPRAGPRTTASYALDDDQGAGQGRHVARPLLGGARQLADAADRAWATIGRRPAGSRGSSNGARSGPPGAASRSRASRARSARFGTTVREVRRGLCRRRDQGLRDQRGRGALGDPAGEPPRAGRRPPLDAGGRRAPAPGLRPDRPQRPVRRVLVGPDRDARDGELPGPLRPTFIPAENRIGQPGQYLREGWQSRFSPHYGATFLGGAEAAYEYALDYIRVQGKAERPLRAAPRRDDGAQPGVRATSGSGTSPTSGRRAGSPRRDRRATAPATCSRRGRPTPSSTPCTPAGPAALIRPSPLERIYRDLSFYVRHDNSDHVLATIGREVLGQPHDGSFFNPPGKRSSGQPEPETE